LTRERQHERRRRAYGGVEVLDRHRTPSIEHNQRPRLGLSAQPPLEQTGAPRECRPVDSRGRSARPVRPQAVQLDGRERLGSTSNNVAATIATSVRQPRQG
jgi:hypothetical protein